MIQKSQQGMYYYKEHREGKPMLIYLPHHGLRYTESKTPEDNFKRLETDPGFQLFKGDNRFSLYVPMQYDKYHGWTGHPSTGHDGEAFLKEIVKGYIGDVFVTGHSLGGQGTWDLCNMCPDIVTSAVVCAGHSNSYQLTIAIKGRVKIRAYHGTSDRSEESYYEGKQSFINWYKGDASNWFPLEGQGHGINGYVYHKDRGVPEWLLAQGTAVIPEAIPEDEIIINPEIIWNKTQGLLIINGVTYKLTEL